MLCPAAVVTKIGTRYALRARTPARLGPPVAGANRLVTSTLLTISVRLLQSLFELSLLLNIRGDPPGNKKMGAGVTCTLRLTLFERLWSS